MAYNNRRGMYHNIMPANSSSNVGMRRPQQPPQATNFVRGGQLAPQNKPLVTMPIKHQQAQQQQQQQPILNSPNFTRPPNQQKPPETIPQPVSVPVPIMETPEVKPAPAEQPKTETTPSVESEAEGGAKKPWQFGKNKKVAKKERLRRRNMRLYKILTPKNAVMILNELVKSVSYAVKDDPQMSSEGPLYQATVIIDDNHYHGYGRSKAQAKNCAAEAALKFLVKNKRFTMNDVKSEDGVSDEGMDTDGGESTLPWQHVASFALYKLFSSWGDDPTAISNAASLTDVSDGSGNKPENRPAKRIPANPEQMNPLMLLNQMLPNAKFEEFGKSGNPPNCIFTFQCTVDDVTYLGSGPNKKTAKKMAAFAVCHKVLGVQYPPDVYTPPPVKNEN